MPSTLKSTPLTPPRRADPRQSIKSFWQCVFLIKRNLTFADANDMMKSADLSGTAGECSDTGCVINTSPFADGTSSSGDGGSMTVTYTEDTVFQKGTVKSDGSSYFLEDSEKDRIGGSDFVLCFGKQQADGSYLADRIIMIVFN